MIKQTSYLSSIILILSLSFAGCTDPVVAPYEDAPAPTGVIKGSILYIGPGPACVDDVPMGKVILTLFEYDNPPPPYGSALNALNLLSLPATDLFSTSDCGLPVSDPSAYIQRSVSFTWPNVPLATEQNTTAAYQIRGFFDYDGDFNPFFGVSKLPTAGDIVGGAFVDPTAAVKIQAAISFESYVERPQGQVVNNVTVTLAGPVITERPMFELGADTKAMDSASTLTVMDTANPTVPQLNPILYEEGLWAINEMTINALNPSDASNASALEAAGIFVDPSQPYNWLLEPVDFYGGIDGVDDLFPLFANHPLLVDFKWKTPLVFFSRARRPEEIQGNVPSVTLIGTVKQLTEPVSPVQNSIEIVVPPVALVNLDPSDPACLIPFFAPGNLTSAYESQASDCQELPTGEYDIAVFHGFAATLVDGVPSYAFTGQAWSIPNELGAADSIYFNPGTGQLPEEIQLVSQGPMGRYRVVENSASDGVRNQCEEALDLLAGVTRPIDFIPVPANCCAAVEHLCDVPLCETTAAEAGGRIRRSNAIEATTGLPNCVPFLMPASCCGE